MEACLDELGVRKWGSNPIDLMGDTTILAESTARVGGI